MIASCEWSLARLGIEKLDLYLLHWRGRHPLEATLEGFQALLREGLIKAWGVSNFDTADMEELVALNGGDQVQTDQVLYNLQRRGIEHELLPWCRERKISDHGLFAVRTGPDLARPSAYSRRRRAPRRRLGRARLDVRQDDMITIPKSSNEAHMRENEAALDLVPHRTPSSASSIAHFRAPSEAAVRDAIVWGIASRIVIKPSRNFAVQSGKR